MIADTVAVSLITNAPSIISAIASFATVLIGLKNRKAAARADSQTHQKLDGIAATVGTIPAVQAMPQEPISGPPLQ